MTRDEVQAEINEMISEAEISQRSARAAARSGDYAISCGHVGEELGLRRAAQMLAEALEKSEARPSPVSRVEVYLGSLIVAQCGISFGSSWHAEPAPFVEAGPGLWRCIGMPAADGGGMVVTMDQVTP